MFLKIIILFSYNIIIYLWTTTMIKFSDFKDKSYSLASLQDILNKATQEYVKANDAVRLPPINPSSPGYQHHMVRCEAYVDILEMAIVGKTKFGAYPEGNKQLHLPDRLSSFKFLYTTEVCVIVSEDSYVQSALLKLFASAKIQFKLANARSGHSVFRSAMDRPLHVCLFLVETLEDSLFGAPIMVVNNINEDVLIKTEERLAAIKNEMFNRGYLKDSLTQV
ncbi:hypothetical protein SHAb15599_00135 [Acinetobacter phage SH-Ab 15599]|nr:hypothetical protein SHAb15599_00135 [Acinetobacter phage SH-Ab 15599]